MLILQIHTIRRNGHSWCRYKQRMEEFNLKTDRADVIVPAAEIFLIIAGIVKAEYIHVPVIGLADGIIDNLYAIYLKTE